MKLDDIPGVSAVVESGADDPVFDSLLFLGPFVIATIVVLGRAPVTAGLAAAYVAAFLGYVLFRGVST